MTHTVLTVLVTSFLLSSCSAPKQELQGSWQIAYISPTQDSGHSNGDMLTYGWLNITGEQSQWTFRGDSLLAGKAYQGPIKVVNGSISYPHNGSYETIYTYKMEGDTLVLRTTNGQDMVKFTRVSTGNKGSE